MLPDLTIFDFLAARQASGTPAALVTVTSVTGASVRNPGAHMAVDEAGNFVGSLSGGCIEAAVVAEAKATIASNAVRNVRYGAGSPFIDIRLPCGGSVDLLMTPVSGALWPRTLADTLAERRPASLRLPKKNAAVSLAQGVALSGAGWNGDMFEVNHIPKMRLQIIGHGASVMALAELALALPADLLLLSPDSAIIADAASRNISAHLLKDARGDAALMGDPWTATIFLFHDHDWEAELLKAVLARPSFYIGAMGSLKTHAERLDRLRLDGVSEATLARLTAPIGLFHSSRDPSTLALSTLAQVVQAFHQECVMVSPAGFEPATY